MSSILKPFKSQQHSNESTSLLPNSRQKQSYSYVEISNTDTALISSLKLYKKCNHRGVSCNCQNNVTGNSATVNDDDDESTSQSKHRLASSLLLIITVVLSFAIIGSALLLRHFNSPTTVDNNKTNPLMLSVFTDDKSTSRFEVVDNTVDIIKGKRARRVLASGTYIKNAEGNGWNHLTVRAGKE